MASTELKLGHGQVAGNLRLKLGLNRARENAERKKPGRKGSREQVAEPMKGSDDAGGWGAKQRCLWECISSLCSGSL